MQKPETNSRTHEFVMYFQDQPLMFFDMYCKRLRHGAYRNGTKTQSFNDIHVLFHFIVKNHYTSQTKFSNYPCFSYYINGTC
jgi:hypothetical protein